MRTGVPVKSGITTGKRAHPKNITTPHCQGQHTELDRLLILSSACHGEMSRKALQKDALRSPGQCLPGEECGGHGHGKVQAPLTTHCSPTPTGHGIRPQISSVEHHSQPRQSLVILEQQLWQRVQQVPVESSKKEKGGEVGNGETVQETQKTFQKAQDSESEVPAFKY